MRSSASKSGLSIGRIGFGFRAGPRSIFNAFRVRKVLESRPNGGFFAVLASKETRKSF